MVPRFVATPHSTLNLWKDLPKIRAEILTFNRVGSVEKVIHSNDLFTLTTLNNTCASCPNLSGETIFAFVNKTFFDYYARLKSQHLSSDNLE